MRDSCTVREWELWSSGGERLGVIRSFSIEGEALWHTELSSFGTIDAMSGAESMRMPFDMVVTARVGDRLYGFVNDPYPRVKVLRVHPDWLK